MTTIRRKAAEGLQVGDCFTVSREFKRRDVTQFAAISRDYNPVHFDRRFAETKQFSDCICHGLLVASLVTEVGGQIGWLASGMNFIFKGPVYFGDTIRCDFTIVDIDDKGWSRAEVVFINQHEVTVMEATITGIIPGTEEKQVMSDMVAEGDPTNKIAGEMNI